MTDKRKFNLKDWFFRGAQRPPSKSRLRKLMVAAQMLIAPGYLRWPSGALKAPARKFRRGRAWVRGELIRTERFKAWRP